MSLASSGHEYYLLSFEGGEKKRSALNAVSTAGAQSTQIAAKEFQVAELDTDQGSSIASDSGSPSDIQLTRPIGDVVPQETSFVHDTQEGSCDSPTHALDDMISWIGSSDLERDNRLLPRRLTQEHKGNTNLVRAHVVCRNNESGWYRKDEGGCSIEDVQHHKLDDFDENWELELQSSQELIQQTFRQENQHWKKMEHVSRTLPVSQRRIKPDSNEISQACSGSVVCQNSQTYIDEEEEWNERQRTTGLAGRLVEYNVDDDPRQDIRFRGGMDCPLVVAHVLAAGCAHKAGVKVGDRLASINGKKEFVGMSVHELNESSLMNPPALFVFIGFVGKLHAEIRLTPNKNQAPIGIPWKHAVNSMIIPSSSVQLCEEHVLNTSSASLFMAVSDDECELPELLFELNQSDARVCMNSALAHRDWCDSSKIQDRRQQLQDHTFLQHSPRDLANTSGMDQINWKPSMRPRYAFGSELPRFCRSSRRSQSPCVCRSGPRTCVQMRPCMDPDIFHEPVQE